MPPASPARACQDFTSLRPAAPSPVAYSRNSPGVTAGGGSIDMATFTPAVTQIASGLRFPEGPVAMPDGSVVLVEIERQTLSRVTPDGKIHVIARLGGGPNGAA